MVTCRQSGSRGAGAVSHITEYGDEAVQDSHVSSVFCIPQHPCDHQDGGLCYFSIKQTLTVITRLTRGKRGKGECLSTVLRNFPTKPDSKRNFICTPFFRSTKLQYFTSRISHGLFSHSLYWLFLQPRKGKTALKRNEYIVYN